MGHINTVSNANTKGLSYGQNAGCGCDGWDHSCHTVDCC